MCVPSTTPYTTKFDSLTTPIYPWSNLHRPPDSVSWKVLRTIRTPAVWSDLMFRSLYFQDTAEDSSCSLMATSHYWLPMSFPKPLTFWLVILLKHKVYSRISNVHIQNYQINTFILYAVFISMDLAHYQHLSSSFWILT